MEKFKTRIRQFFYKLKNEWLVFDNLTLIICIALCLWWTYGSINSMSRNWSLENTLREKQNELSLVTLEVETLELENIYYQSEEYQELSARAKLNKQFEGETLVYLPANSDYAKTKHEDNSETATVEKTNLEKWLEFLF